MARRRRVRGWPVVVVPILLASACSIPLTASTFTTTFESEFLDVPSTTTVDLDGGETYSFLRPDAPFDDEHPDTTISVRDSDGDRQDLDDPRALLPWLDADTTASTTGELARFQPDRDGDYRIRVRGDEDDSSPVILQRRPFALSSRPAQLNLAGSIAALALFVFMYRRWRRARIDPVTADAPAP